MSTPDEIATDIPSSAPETGTSSVSVPADAADADEPNSNEKSKSALRENIELKGKNAYYYAHGHKATGPKWDGKAEPKLLSRQSSTEAGHSLAASTKTLSFEYYKSNITTYAFLDDGMKVKLYLDMEGVGQKCADEDVKLDFTETSLCLVINNYKPQPQCLSFGKLTANIKNATFLKKKDKIILTLTKAEEGEWHTINDKGSPDHEVV
jgi:hypothetical protein